MNGMILIANSLYSPVSDEINKELYAAGFIGNDHNASQSMEEALKNRARILSFNQEAFEPDKWILIGMDYSEETYSCACGKPNLKKIYKVKNQDTSHIMTVGGSCLKRYFLQEPDDQLMSYMSGNSKAGVNTKSLKKKYDGLILSCLGFKKYQEYSVLRALKKDTPIASDEIIKATLSQGLSSYDSVKWESLLLRAKRLHQYLLDAPKRKAKELAELKKKVDTLNKQERDHQKYSTVRGTTYENREKDTFPKKNVYVKIDPVTMKEFDEFWSHVPTVITGTNYDIDVVDGKWFCRCEDCGTMIYNKVEGNTSFMKCDSCDNVFKPDEDNPFA